jgi:hypothetical protein
MELNKFTHILFQTHLVNKVCIPSHVVPVVMGIFPKEVKVEQCNTPVLLQQLHHIYSSLYSIYIVVVTIQT